MISILCVRGAGDKQARDIQDKLIPTEHIARLRGQAYLDGAYYNRSTRTIRASFQDVIDGQIADVRDPHIGMGNWHVEGVRILIQRGKKIILNLELEGKYEDPE